MLKKTQSDKINISATNELLLGKTHDEIAKNYRVTRPRISQIGGDFKNELENAYNCGKTPYLTLFYYLTPSIEDK